jgi:hypothetical protein
LQLGRKLTFRDLVALKQPRHVVAENIAGLANQIRCVLAIQVLGHTPLTRVDAAFKKQTSATEGIDMNEILGGLAPSRSTAITPRYQDWFLPPPPDHAEDAEVFNNLNWYGLVNMSALPHMKAKTKPYRDAFAALSPILPTVDASLSATPAPLGVHLRMFGRNYTPRFVAAKIGQDNAGRFYAKQAWSADRVAALHQTLQSVSEPGDAVTLYTDDADHGVVLQTIADLKRTGRHPGIADTPSGLSHSSAAFHDLLALTRHPRLVVTATSTFGHLGALLSETLDIARSV